MLAFFLWYLLISFIGLLTFPLAYQLFARLTDRGYAFSRALGWLLWGYIYWLLASLGVLQNNTGGELFALLVVAAASVWAARRAGWRQIVDWLASQRRVIITVEILFGVAFGLWAVVRAANPEIVGTEKPMELAFINAILRSPTFPPHDPWLSGYAISYYHFGYILVAMLARLTLTTGGVAFNLAIALVFGLAAVGSYGLLYNLLARRMDDHPSQTSDRGLASVVRPLLAPFFVLIVSNLGGLLHLLRLGGVFWRLDENGQMVSPIWAWLDMGRFSQPPPADPFPHWWWWQASRVVQDFDFNWANKGDVIDEFPFFSFLLGDLHPHVLAMPFAFLIMGWIFNMYQTRRESDWVLPNLNLSPLTFGVSALLLGSLGFLNTWDAPFYVTLFSGAYVLRQMQEGGEWYGAIFSGSSAVFMLKEFFRVAIALGLAAIVLYLPFYLSFSSQAGGLLPNLIYVTRGVYLWVMFLPLLVPIFVFIGFLWRSRKSSEALKGGLTVTGSLIASLLLLSLILAGIISNLNLFSAIAPEAAFAADAFLSSQAAPGWGALIGEGLLRRLKVPGTLLTLAALLTLVIANLWHRRADDEDEPTPRSSADAFVLLLILTAGLLVLGPEFIYLRDLFGYRINTIFKFYFLVWLMWGIAAAYACGVLWRRLQGTGRIVFQISMVIILLVSLIYPILGLWSKTNQFNPSQWTLDGTAYLQNNNPDEAAAMAWLRQAPLGVVAEAVGGSYTSFARMASHSGQPTVLGWEFHEVQWRGGTTEMGSRKSDIERLYCLPNWQEAEWILQQYDIRYVVVGSMERTHYITGAANCPAGLSETKFARNLEIAFQMGDVVIYEYIAAE